MKSAVEFAIFVMFTLFQVCFADWDNWWTYEGISGPAYWGMFNTDWRFCERGRKQSPINIDPHSLLFDPSLTRLNVDPGQVRAQLTNTGRLLKISSPGGAAVLSPALNISGGPLVYTYRLSQLHIHFGRELSVGSEHKMHGQSFPVEIQIYGYNSHLYTSFAEAIRSVHGTVAVAVMVQIGNKSNAELSKIAACFPQVRYKDSTCNLTLSLDKLLPSVDKYMTYEGSLTQPGCWESTTWIVLNKPLYINKDQLSDLQQLMKGDANNTRGLLADNSRPIQPLYRRTITTNIHLTEGQRKACPAMEQHIIYKANTAG